MTLRSLGLFLLALLLAACSSPLQGEAPTVLGPTVTPNPDATPTATPFGPELETPTSQQAPSSTPILSTATLIPAITTTAASDSGNSFIPASYILHVVLDYSGHAISVDETISYTNLTGQTLNDLVLAVEPALWKDCFIPGNLTINGLAAPGTVISGDSLKIPLAIPAANGDNLELFIHYDLNLPAADVYHVFGYNADQVNLVDWYPFIVPFAPGQGWLLHPPANVGEHLVYDEQDFDMTLHLKDESTPLIIAASAPAESISYGWHYHLDGVRSFALSVSPGYQTASESSGGVKIISYYFTGDDMPGQMVLDEVAKAVSTFDDLFGQDPYSSLSIVETPYFDGMEYDGLFFLSQDFYHGTNGTVLNNLIDIGVHETAHQWWFGSVASDQALEPWLDEALATYSERLFYEMNYPQVTAWQAFRVDAYAPTGWVDTDIYHGVNFRTYANAVYLRGAQFLQTIRIRIGDPAFFTFLKDYAAQMAGKRATAQDFFSILDKHTTINTSDIISEYFQEQNK